MAKASGNPQRSCWRKYPGGCRRAYCQNAAERPRKLVVGMGVPVEYQAGGHRKGDDYDGRRDPLRGTAIRLVGRPRVWFGLSRLSVSRHRMAAYALGRGHLESIASGP